MIEGPAGPDSSRGPVRQAPLEWARARLRSGGGILVRWILLSGRHQEESDALLLRLRLAERVFWVVLGGLSVYLVADLFLFPHRPPAIRVSGAGPGVQGSGSGGQVATSEPVAVEDQLKPLSEYRDVLAARNPFGLTPRTVGVPAGGGGSRGRLEEVTSTLSIVGIGRGRIPEALIEDKTAGRTHFVKVGDRVNGLTVTSIDERGVTLTYEGEEITLQ